MGIIAKPLSYLLIWLYELVGSYGIAILILTVVIKLCLYPLYAKQIKSSMKMTEVQPKMKEIQQKYAKDRELMNQKMMELYKDEGVSMYGGCLPMIVQMFIIMGLFAAIHEPFLWIKDLAQPDKWILPISAGAATFFSFSMNSAMASMGGGNAQQTAMMSKVMKYFFPIMILWFARTYPAGLALYWFGSQVIQIFYNIRFNKLKKAQRDAKQAKSKKKK